MIIKLIKYIVYLYNVYLIVTIVITKNVLPMFTVNWLNSYKVTTITTCDVQLQLNICYKLSIYLLTSNLCT